MIVKGLVGDDMVQGERCQPSERKFLIWSCRVRMWLSGFAFILNGQILILLSCGEWHMVEAKALGHSSTQLRFSPHGVLTLFPS